VITESKDLITSPVDEKMIFEIFKCLANNFIYNVAFKEKKELPIIFTEKSVVCNCSLCLYRRLDLVSLMKNKTSEGSSKEKLFNDLRYAYGQYKIGNFVNAANAFKAIYTERQDKKDLITYIISFNLVHLEAFLRNYYWDDSKIQSLANELSEIPLEFIYKDCRNDFEDKELIDWIHNKSFIKETFSRLHERVNTITDHFYGQNTGFNDNTRQLMEDYLMADAFLNQNSIIYDAYSDFDSLTNLFTQGLLASYGCSPLLGGRLDHFTDLLLEKLMLSGSAEVIQKFLKRYKLEEINYESSKPGKHIC
jgi:hypothetical protein